jgi:carboxyl-terminal processing protease
MLPAVVLLLVAQAPSSTPVPTPVNELSDAVKKVAEVMARVEAEAADRVDSSAMIYGGAIPGMLRVLDPHSIFLDPDQYQQLKEMSNAEQKGFGSIVSILPGRVFVLQTLPGTPSARSGLAAGDEIVAVNGIPLGGLEPEQLMQLLSESRRQPARISVRRSNTPRLLDFQLIPETVAAPSVDRAYLLEPGIGYVRISNFEIKTADEAKAAIEKLGGTSLKGLVLDLRNNPGGIVEPAMQTASMFLQPGQRILYARGRAKKEEEIKVPNDTSPYAFPVSVVINGKTASAAEIVSAALQDNHRAKIFGQRSFGKGLVQSVYPLSQNSGMALTVAFYYSPNGRNIQRPLKNVQLSTETKDGDRGGVKPDGEVDTEAFTRLRGVLDASASFTTFTTEYLRKGPSVTPQFDVTGPLLDEFRSWLAARKIQPGVADWSRDVDWIRSRLKQEIFNQALGVEKGDEVEALRDPQIKAALDAIRQR